MSSTQGRPPAAPGRIASIDQFRGYAIFGMLLVDYFGLFRSGLLTPGESKGLVSNSLAHIWQQVHHVNPGVHFADTIAPIFMFVVGMGMRLSMARRIDQVGLWEARKSLIKRYALLTLIAFTLYTGYLWDALINIGLAGLIVLWIVDKKPAVRISVGVALVAAYTAIFANTSYGEWLYRTLKYTDDTMPVIWKIIPFGPELLDCPINGGPLGHWSWAFMMIGGTIAYDVMASKNTRRIITGCLVWGLALCAIGWLLMKPPVEGQPHPWVFSKNYMTAPFAFWTTGLCFLHLLAFYLVCDVLKVNIPHMSVFGLNPLTIYILQWCIAESAHRFVPGEPTTASGAVNWLGIGLGFLAFYGVCYGTAYWLYRKKIIIKL